MAKREDLVLNPDCCSECEERAEQLDLLHTCPVCKQQIHDCKSNRCLQGMSRTKMFLGAMMTLFTGAAALGGFLSGWFLK